MSNKILTQMLCMSAMKLFPDLNAIALWKVGISICQQKLLVHMPHVLQNHYTLVNEVFSSNI